MLAVVDVIVPVFGLIAAGWAATFTPIFDARGARALSGFVFYFAIPLLLFAKVATTPAVGGGASSLLATYYGATGLIFLAGALLAARLFRRRADEAVLIGFAAAYGNGVMIGIPVVLTVLGPAATFPLMLIISFHGLVFFTATTVLVESFRGAGAGPTRILVEIARGTASNPILVALVLGLAWNRLELPLPSTGLAFAELAGSAAIPCALFATGATLRSFGVRTGLPLVATIVALKGIAHPLLVLVLAHALGLDSLALQVAVLLAAVPVGVNPYLFAARYQTAEAECATAVAVSTPFAVVTVSTAILALDLAGG